jgi:hypothetical protein
LLRYNRYGTKFLNEWDGELKLDEENNAVFSSLLVAGEKNNENKFTGVVIGDIQKTHGEEEGEANGYGIYGFKEGVKSFSLDENGNADFAGRLSAPSGEIGALSIDSNGFSYPGFAITPQEGIVKTKDLSVTNNLDVKFLKVQGHIEINQGEATITGEQKQELKEFNRLTVEERFQANVDGYSSS